MAQRLRRALRVTRETVRQDDRSGRKPSGLGAMSMPSHPLSRIAVIAFAVYDPLLFTGIGALAVAVQYLWSQGIGLGLQFGAIASIVYFLGQISGA
jgi:hypothetical protein